MDERKLDGDSMKKNRIVEHVLIHHERAQKTIDTQRTMQAQRRCGGNLRVLEKRGGGNRM